MKEIKGTAAPGVTLRHQHHDGNVVDVKFNPEKWNMRAVRSGDKIVISHNHPSLDYIFDAKVTHVRWGIITLEWKSSWKRLEEYLPEQPS